MITLWKKFMDALSSFGHGPENELVKSTRLLRAAWEEKLAVMIPEPTLVGTKIVTEGEINHRHKFERAKWDRERFGSELTDMGEFTGIWHALFRCSCGCEVIENVRAMI